MRFFRPAILCHHDAAATAWPAPVARLTTRRRGTTTAWGLLYLDGMQSKQLGTILRMILVGALAAPVLGACGGQTSDGPAQTSGNQAGNAGTGGQGFSGNGSGGTVTAGSGGSTAGAGGVTAAGAGGTAAGAGGDAAGAGGVATAGAGGVATGGAGGDPGEDFHALDCNNIVVGLAHDLGVDFVALWRGTGDFNTGETTMDWMQVAVDGTPCVVPEKSSCGDVLDKAEHDPGITGLRPSSGGNTVPQFERVVATQGGLVTSAKDKPTLLAMFGNKLDTDAKLLLWLRYSFGMGAPCNVLVRRVGSHYEVKGAVVINDCPYTTEQQTLAVNEDGGIVVLEHGAQSAGGGCAGRRPAGLQAAAPRAADRTGQHFAAIAHLEAASVEAFARLTSELSLLGAPAALLDGCEEARQDEIRHTAAMTQLAARFGAAVPAVSLAPTRLRSAAEIAEENAIEGCVRETFGALVACFQAEQSPDAEVRAALAQIAEDETRHAALSWEIQGWLERQAGCGGVLARVGAEAVAGLRAEIEAGAFAGGEVAGLPDRAMAQRLLAGLEAALLN